MSAVNLASLLRALPAEAGVAVVHDGDRVIVAAVPTEVVVADGVEAFERLNRIEESDGLWVGFLAYDLGRAVETVAIQAADDRGIPDLAFARFDARLTMHPDGSNDLEGNGEGADVLRRGLWLAQDPRRRARRRLGTPTWSTSLDPAGHAHRVRDIHHHLDAGDCYQVNLTRRLTHDRAIDPVELFCALAEFNPSPHATLIRFGTRGPSLAIVGASPERFLSIDGDHLETCPIKGTHVSAEALGASAKDEAEHIMIVDLARNDLGRVCVPGSVRVSRLMATEAHPGLHHLVSTIEGQRAPETSLGQVVRALFPAASITGAPKPAVMRMIEALEPVRRGVYCGATGWIDPGAGRAELAVAIRTFTITAHHTDLGVGGGIVADSNADDEWHETELKAHRLLDAAARTARRDLDRFGVS